MSTLQQIINQIQELIQTHQTHRYANYKDTTSWTIKTWSPTAYNHSGYKSIAEYTYHDDHIRLWTSTHPASTLDDHEPTNPINDYYYADPEFPRTS